jgi:hypothetical protein
MWKALEAFGAAFAPAVGRPTYKASFKCAELQNRDTSRNWPVCFLGGYHSWT